MTSTERWESMTRIGHGTYGVVYKAFDTDLNRLVAVKKLKPDPSDEGISSTTLREIALLKDLQHKNIVNLLDAVYTNEDKLHLVFEYLDQDLSNFLHNNDDFVSAELTMSYLYQLLSGMAFAHGRRILHRDLKPQNLLLSKNGVLKIGDFGLARSFSLPVKTYTHEVVTLWYRAPEVLLGSRQYSTPLDIWSVGCIFWEIATCSPLFAGQCEWEQLIKIFKVLGTPNNDIWPGVEELPDYIALGPKFKPQDLSTLVPLRNDGTPVLNAEGIDLLCQMLQYDPAKRISAKDALKHPYFHPFLQRQRQLRQQQEQVRLRMQQESQLQQQQQMGRH